MKPVYRINQLHTEDVYKMQLNESKQRQELAEACARMGEPEVAGEEKQFEAFQLVVIMAIKA
jgi:hypothetical protein